MKKMSGLYFLAGLIAAIVLSYALHSNSILNISNIMTTYQPTDMEINYFGGLNAYRGNGLYNAVSSIYPPGRSLAVSELFEHLGPAVPALTVYFNFVAPFLFPILLYVLSYQILQTTALRKGALFLSFVPMLIDWMFVRSGQEGHVTAALFFVALMHKAKVTKLRLFVIGMLLGILPLFRVEGFIAAMIGIGIAYASEWRTLRKVAIPVVAGTLTVWLPIAGYLVYHGALPYALHDLLYLALVAQPKIMAQAIQVGHELLFTGVVIFLMSSAVALFVQTRNKGIKAFAIFSVLSFASALNLSDEGHLWYGSVWISLYCVYALTLVPQVRSLLSVKALKKIVVWTGVFVGLGMLIIEIKHPTVFVLFMIILFAAVYRWVDRKHWAKIHVAGLIATLLVFHSVSYVKLRYRPLSLNFTRPQFEQGLFTDEGDEIAGIQFPQEHIDVLNEIQSDIPDSEEYLFIYPDHVLYYEFFAQQNPTRYYHFTAERTPQIHKHIIQQIEENDARYILLFPTKGQLRGEEVFLWIQENTGVVKTYQLDGQEVELRVRK